MKDMPKYKLEITATALHEIERIKAYIADELNNPEAASGQCNRILLAAEALTVFPKLYRVRRVDAEGNEIRFLQVDNYMIIYYVDENSLSVNVIHVTYSRRDISSII